MYCARAIPLLGVMLSVGGCQTDLAVRQVDENGGYSRSVYVTEGLAFESDTRRVLLNFSRPPLEDVVDSDTFIGYLSVPLHPVHGPQFDDPSIGVGWSDVSMSFAGIFEPFPSKIPNGSNHRIVPEDLHASPADWPAAAPGASGTVTTSVDPRYRAHAELLRDHLYRLEFAGTPAPTASSGDSADDD